MSTKKEITLKEVMDGRKVKTVEELAIVAVQLANFMLSIKPHERECAKVFKDLKKDKK